MGTSNPAQLRNLAAARRNTSTIRRDTVPTENGSNVGDEWEQTDPSDATIGLWGWDGNDWTPKPLGSPAINDLDKFVEDEDFVGQLVKTISRADLFIGEEFRGGRFIGTEFEGATITGGLIQTKAGVDGIKLSGSEIRANGADGNPIFWVNTDAQMVQLTGQISVLTPDGRGSIRLLPSTVNEGWTADAAVIEFGTGDASQSSPGRIYSYSEGNGLAHALRMIMWSPRRSTYSQASLQLVSGSSGFTSAAFLTAGVDSSTQLGLHGNGQAELRAPAGVTIKAPSVYLDGDLSANGQPVPRTTGGIVSITPTAADTPTMAVVTFPVDRFTAPPAVALAPATSVPGTQVKGVGAINVTKESMQIYVTRTNVVNTSVNWVAVQG